MGRPYPLSRWTRFWRALLAWLLVITVIPVASADEGQPDHVQTCYPTSGVTISAGCTDWYVYWPTEFRGPGTYQIDVTASTTTSPSSGGFTITAPAAGQAMQGCTLEAFTSTGTARSATASIPLTATSADCLASFRLQLNTGTTNLGGPQVGQGFSYSPKTLEDSLLRVLADLAWLVWLAFVVLTRLIPAPPLRLAVGLAGYSILALPLNPSSFVTLGTLQSCVLVYDVIQVLRR